MDWKDEWCNLLREMLTDFRQRCPEDTRSDRELAASLMDYFCEKGLVGKNEEGKYVVGRLVEPEAEPVSWPTER